MLYKLDRIWQFAIIARKQERCNYKFIFTLAKSF